MKTDIFAKGQVGLHRMDLPLEKYTVQGTTDI